MRHRRNTSDQYLIHRSLSKKSSVGYSIHLIFSPLSVRFWKAIVLLWEIERSTRWYKLHNALALKPSKPFGCAWNCSNWWSWWDLIAKDLFPLKLIFLFFSLVRRISLIINSPSIVRFWYALQVCLNTKALKRDLAQGHRSIIPVHGYTTLTTPYLRGSSPSPIRPTPPIISITPPWLKINRFICPRWRESLIWFSRHLAFHKPPRHPIHPLPPPSTLLPHHRLSLRSLKHSILTSRVCCS